MSRIQAALLAVLLVVVAVVALPPYLDTRKVSGAILDLELIADAALRYEFSTAVACGTPSALLADSGVDGWQGPYLRRLRRYPRRRRCHPIVPVPQRPSWQRRGLRLLRPLLCPLPLGPLLAVPLLRRRPPLLARPLLRPSWLPLPVEDHRCAVPGPDDHGHRGPWTP